MIYLFCTQTCSSLDTNKQHTMLKVRGVDKNKYEQTVVRCRNRDIVFTACAPLTLGFALRTDGHLDVATETNQYVIILPTIPMHDSYMLLPDEENDHILVVPTSPRIHAVVTEAKDIQVVKFPVQTLDFFVYPNGIIYRVPYEAEGPDITGYEIRRMLFDNGDDKLMAIQPTCLGFSKGDIPPSSTSLPTSTLWWPKMQMPRSRL